MNFFPSPFLRKLHHYLDHLVVVALLIVVAHRTLQLQLIKETRSTSL